MRHSTPFEKHSFTTLLISTPSETQKIIISMIYSLNLFSRYRLKTVVNSKKKYLSIYTFFLISVRVLYWVQFDQEREKGESERDWQRNRETAREERDGKLFYNSMLGPDDASENDAQLSEIMQTIHFQASLNGSNMLGASLSLLSLNAGHEHQSFSRDDHSLTRQARAANEISTSTSWFWTIYFHFSLILLGEWWKP